MPSFELRMNYLPTYGVGGETDLAVGGGHAARNDLNFSDAFAGGLDPVFDNGDASIMYPDLWDESMSKFSH